MAVGLMMIECSSCCAPSGTCLVGAGTQVLTNVGWIVIFGTPGEFTRAMLKAAGWVINLAIAQWIIRRVATTAERSTAPGYRKSRATQPEICCSIGMTTIL